MKGTFGKYSLVSSQGEQIEKESAVRYMASFKPPVFFEKKLNFCFSLKEGETIESGSISFSLDRNKAMGYSLKKELSEQISVEKANIRFESLQASPTKTLLTGTIQDIVELGMDQITGERMRPYQMEVKLLADGRNIPLQEAGMSTDIKGITFHFAYDALPPEVKQIQIYLERFGADHDVKQQINLKEDNPKELVRILGQEIIIDKIAKSKGYVYHHHYGGKCCFE